MIGTFVRSSGECYVLFANFSNLSTCIMQGNVNILLGHRFLLLHVNQYISMVLHS
jgi:hypothetical protein